MFPASYYDSASAALAGVTADTTNAKAGYTRCAKMDASSATVSLEKLLDNTKTEFACAFEMMTPSSISSGLNFHRYTFLANNGSAVYLYIRTTASGFTCHFLVWDNAVGYRVDYDDPTVYSYDAYHRFEIGISGIATTSWTVNFKVDGTTLYSGTTTNVATTTFSAGPVMDDAFSGNISYFQTHVWSYTAADFPIGQIQGALYLPDGVGTHNLDAATSVFFEKVISGTPTALTTSETTSYQVIDDAPLSADSDAIRIKTSTGSPNTPTLRAWGAVTYSPNNVVNGAIASAAPTGKAAGDGLLLICGSSSNAFTVTTPTGWTKLFTEKASGTAVGGKIYVFGRIADGTATDTPSVTFAGLTTGTTGTPGFTVIGAYQNLDAVTLDAVVATATDTTATTTTTIPAHTTTVDKSLVVGIALKMQDLAQTSTVATFTERVDSSTTNAVGLAVEVSDLVKTPAGSSGTAAVTWSSSTSARTFALSFSVKATLAVSQPTNTLYSEHTFGDESTQTSAPLLVEAVVGYDLGSAVTSTMEMRLRDTAAGGAATPEESIFSTTTLATTGKKYAVKVFTQRPNTGGAWTLTALNGLRVRFGYTGAASGQPRLEVAQLWAIYAVAGSTPKSGTDANGTTTEAALLTITAPADAGSATEVIANRIIVADADGINSPVEVGSLRMTGTDANSSPAETGTITVPITGTDADGTPAEVASLALSASDVDGTPTEAGSLAYLPTVSDTDGTPTEAATLRLAGTDTAGDTEASALTATLSGADSDGTPGESGALALSASDADGVPVETAAATVPVTGTDTGTDSETAALRFTLADTGSTSAESAVLAVIQAITDANGTTTESANAASITQISGSDSGLGTDASVLVAKPIGSDSNAGAVEAVALIAALAGAESASGSDAGSLAAALIGTQAGSDTETAAFAVAFSVSDTGTDAETVVLVAVTTVGETGSDFEIASIGGSSFLGTDTGVGAQVASMVASVQALDVNASLLDQAVLVASTLVTDANLSPVEAATVVVSALGQDSAVSSEVAALLAKLAGTDAATSLETGRIGVTTGDTGGAAESASARVFPVGTEAVTALELADLMAVLLDSDIATGSDVAIQNLRNLMKAIATGSLRVSGVSGILGSGVKGGAITGDLDHSKPGSIEPGEES